MIIIGITGTLGAGKGTLVDYLVQRKNFIHYSVRAFITAKIIEKGMPVNRDSMVSVANELRSEHHPAYIVEQLYNQAALSGKNCVIESLRTTGEVLLLRTKPNFFLFAVDADPLVRYNRIYFRNTETDQVSYEVFLENEKREMESDDPNKQNIAKCMEMADYRLINDQSIELLNQKMEQILKNIMTNG